MVFSIYLLANTTKCCQKSFGMVAAPALKKEVFGVLKDGREVNVFTLANSKGLVVRVMEYGAALLSVSIPDAAGEFADVTLGYDTLEHWLENTAYFGATVGRFGNRIARGKFTLDGMEYVLATNNEPGNMPCHLHGGVTGFDKVLWAGRAVSDNAVRFTYVSRDDEEGYPGEMTVMVTYTLTEENELIWLAEAASEAPTVVNIVHHSYWNLSGKPGTSIEGHELVIHAPYFLPTDAGLIPTGEIAAVAGTPMDFTKPQRIGARMDADFEPLKLAGGYDHCWVFEKQMGVRPAARLRDPVSGRVMEIFTDQPGMQFYTGNFLDSVGKAGVRYSKRSGLCLETENFPDAPNQPAFPSAILRRGETYRHTLVHRFSTE